MNPALKQERESEQPRWLRTSPGFVRRRLEGRVNLLAVIHNTGWLFADKAMRMLIGVLVGAWVARYLGPSEYGELSYILAFVSFFSVIAALGLDALAIRDIAQARDMSAEILGTVLRLRLVAGIVCYVVALATIGLLHPGDRRALILTAIIAGTVIFQAMDTYDLWFQSQMQSKRTIIAKAVAYVIANGLKVILIITNVSLIGFAIVFLAEVGFAAGALGIAYRTFPTSGKGVWESRRARALMVEAWPYLVSGIAIVIYMRIDQVMLRSMVNEYEVGIFSAALPISTAFYFIPMAISLSVAPTLARRKKDDPLRYDRAIGQLFSVMWWIMLPLAIAVALGSKSLVALLYGKSYAATASVLAVHVFGNIPIALGVAQSNWIVNEKKNMFSLYRTGAGALSNVLLNLALIPRYGAVGAAAASVAAQVVAALLSNVIMAPRIFVTQIRSLFQFESLRS